MIERRDIKHEGKKWKGLTAGEVTGKKNTPRKLYAFSPDHYIWALTRNAVLSLISREGNGKMAVGCDAGYWNEVRPASVPIFFFFSV